MATKAQQRHFLNTAQEHQRLVVKNVQTVLRRDGTNEEVGLCVSMRLRATGRTIVLCIEPL